MNWLDQLGGTARWPKRRWAPLVLFGLGLLVFSVVAGSRLGKQSTDPHFVYQADAWLHGQLSIDPPPARGDDWAKVETVVLKDGAQVRGRRLSSAKNRGWFLTTSGQRIKTADIAKTLGKTHFVSFPPLPSVLMLPQVAIHGRSANDVIPTVLIASLILPLFFLGLRRLAAAELSARTANDDAWLAIGLGFGTVLFFSAVQGRVWFTAHVVGVALAAGYLWSSVEAKRPIVAGLCLGLAAVTRTPMAFMFPLFMFEAWRVFAKTDRRAMWITLAKFAGPVIIIAIAAAALNQARFDSPTEFGHSYLAVKQQAQMEESGLFAYDYLGRNLAVAMTLLPKLSTSYPFVQISGHGLAMWITTPLLLFLLWPRSKGPWHRPLWLCVALVAVPTLFYQNSGWLQFGYRFSLDYMVLLFALIAIGGRPLGRLGRGLIVLAIVINLFGAVTFARHKSFYRFDDYSVILKH